MHLSITALLVIVGVVLLINRHFVVRLAAGLFLVIGVMISGNDFGDFIRSMLAGLAHLVT